MTILYCILSFILGLGIGWVLFKQEKEEDEDDDEMIDWRPRYAPSMEEDMMRELDDEIDAADKSEEDLLDADELCNGCIHLSCISKQDSVMKYDWHCRKRDSYICSTASLLGEVRRPHLCEEKES